MALSSYGGQGSSTSVYDPEFTTSVFLTRRTLENTGGAYSFNGQGSTIGGEEVSDEEFAFRIQAEYLGKALQVIEDARIAKTLDQGVEVNHPSLSVLPIIAQPLDVKPLAAPQPIHPRPYEEDFTKSVIDLCVIRL